MIRDLLRRLLRPAAPDAAARSAALSPAPPPDSGQLGAGGLLWLRQRGEAVTCVDLRPRSALRYGFVSGAILLPPGRFDLVPQLGRVVFVGEGAPDGALWTASTEPWEAAGFSLREPAWKSPLPLLHPVQTEDGAQGWVQDIHWVGDGFHFTVLLEDGQRRQRLEEEALQSRGPRGAAGLGAQI